MRCMGDNPRMPPSCLPYHPDQSNLQQVSPSAWLPEGHLADFIADMVESLDLSAFHARGAKGGLRDQPFHLEMMVKALFCGYTTGMFSAHKLATRLHDVVAFRVLAVGSFPAHRTISAFRALHLSELSALFVRVVKLARGRPTGRPRGPFGTHRRESFPSAARTRRIST
jgi:transposase